MFCKKNKGIQLPLNMVDSPQLETKHKTCKTLQQFCTLSGLTVVCG